MKKTLVITHEYYPAYAGVGRYCYNLFKNFETNNYTVLTDQKFRSKDAPVIIKPLLWKTVRPRWTRGIGVIAKTMKQNNIEILFTPHILPIGQMLYQIHRITKTPYVVSLHGMDIALSLKHKKRITKKILANAQAIITNSVATKNMLAKISLKTPITVITPSLDRELLTINAQTAQEIIAQYNDKKIIITVGRLVRRKGQDMMIHALHKVIKKFSNVHYLIIGRGPDETYFRGLIDELELGEYVTINTSVTDSELGAYYDAANVFAMPTRKRGSDVEGFGIVYLQAAFFSLPIIAGHAAGEYEATGGSDYALHLDGRNISGIVAALLKLLQDAESARALGSRAKAHLNTMPTWAEQASVLKSILQ